MKMEYYETCEEPLAFQIVDDQFAKYREQIIGSHWTSHEVINETSMAKDREELAVMTPEQRRCILHINAYFAVGDVFVIHIIDYIRRVVKHPGWRALETQKASQEDIHAETYSAIIKCLAGDEEESILRAAGEYQTAKRKLEWCESVLGSVESLPTRRVSLAKVVLVMIVTELLFFSSSFATIFWYKSKNLLLGISMANEFIARDEGTHGRIGVYIYNTLQHKLTTSEVTAIVSDAVRIECEFADSIIPSMPGMNAEEMKKYIKFVGDKILTDLGCSPVWNFTNPFSFMNEFGIERRTDFFYRKPTEYQAFVNEAIVIDY